MPKNANIITLEPANTLKKDMTIQLDSGHQVKIKPLEKEERLEIVAPEGQIILNIRLTEQGPVVSLTGAHLELKSTESISMASKKITLMAEEKMIVNSGGPLEINASQEMDIHSDDDIHVVGKMIHLN